MTKFDFGAYNRYQFSVMPRLVLFIVEKQVYIWFPSSALLSLLTNKYFQEQRLEGKIRTGIDGGTCLSLCEHSLFCVTIIIYNTVVSLRRLFVASKVSVLVTWMFCPSFHLFFTCWPFRPTGLLCSQEHSCCLKNCDLSIIYTFETSDNGSQLLQVLEGQDINSWRQISQFSDLNV